MLAVGVGLWRQSGQQALVQSRRQVKHDMRKDKKNMKLGGSHKYIVVAMLLSISKRLRVASLPTTVGRLVAVLHISDHRVNTAPVVLLDP